MLYNKQSYSKEEEKGEEKIKYRLFTNYPDTHELLTETACTNKSKWV
jgi:hypothetical protein